MATRRRSPPTALAFPVFQRAPWAGSFCDTFLSDARRRGARRIDAITATTNTGSVAFHQRLGFFAEVVPDYAGPGQPRVLLSLSLMEEVTDLAAWPLGVCSSLCDH